MQNFIVLERGRGIEVSFHPSFYIEDNIFVMYQLHLMVFEGGGGQEWPLGGKMKV